MLDYTYNTELNFFTHNPELHRLQVLFKGFQNPLPVATMVMAVLHVVVDGDEYKAKLKENMEKVSFVSFSVLIPLESITYIALLQDFIRRP